MANYECEPQDHQWADTSEGSSKKHITTIKCSHCGTGHEIGFLPLAPGTVQVSLRIFPARGAIEVSRELIMWAVTSWGQTCEEIEGDGYTVIRGTPEVTIPEGI
jgi:hypothetical protein